MSDTPLPTRTLDSQALSHLLEISAPFLMLDHLCIQQGNSLTEWRADGYKQLSSADWFFDCHLPSVQAMPATLITEGMLQTLVSLIYCSIDHGAHRSFVTHLQVQLQRGATVGEQLHFRAQLLSNRRGILKGQVQVFAKSPSSKQIIGGQAINEQAIGQGDFQYASPHLMVLPGRSG